MRYLSVCSGIEAATVAWHPLGWTPVAFSEIEPFPAAVLAHHYPDVPNYGDMTRHAEWPLGPGSIDLLVGGTPCQSFSVAGLRKGISDPRGGLMLTYLEIAQRLRPRWIVWENVPGVLSSGGGRDFGSFLGALVELGYGVAYRVLDAQWVRTQRHPRAVPQRRRRVFVVGCLGDGKRAAQVLFERESVQRDSSPRRAPRQGSAADAEAGARAGCWPATVASTLNHAFGDKLGLEDQHALHGAPLFVPDVVGALTAKGPTGMGAPEVDAQHYVASRSTWWDGSDCAGTLTKQNAGGGQRMPDKDNFGAVLQPVGQPTWPAEVAPTLNQSARGSGAPGYSDQEIFSQGAGNLVPQPVPYDLFQITAPVNRQNRKPGDPCHTLARDNAAHAAVVATVDMQACKGNANVGDGSVSPTLCKPSGNDVHAVAFASNLGTRGGDVYDNGVSPTVRTGSGLGIPSPPAVAHTMTVRRLTPKEAERLQAFPDDYTLIPWRKKPADECPDGPRYKALGNSMAVNCMAWIGERIAAVEARND